MIRDATEKDVTYILDIYNDAILNTTAVYAYKPVTFKNRIDWYEQKKADGYPIFVYELDNKVVGFATFGPFRAWPAYKYSIEHSIYINKEYRKKGNWDIFNERTDSHCTGKRVYDFNCWN